MKHHEHAIGWKKANGFDVPMRRDVLALIACHFIAIGLAAFAVSTIKTGW
jgi:hypothetical protein